MKTRTLLLSMAALLAACSNSNEMRRVDLRSAAKDLESIAAQGQLFAEFVMGGHATASYAETYPRYLLQLADEASKKLNETRPEPGTEDTFKREQALARQLVEVVTRLTTTAHKAEQLQEERNEFGHVAQSANLIGREL